MPFFKKTPLAPADVREQYIERAKEAQKHRRMLRETVTATLALVRDARSRYRQLPKEAFIAEVENALTSTLVTLESQHERTERTCPDLICSKCDDTCSPCGACGQSWLTPAGLDFFNLGRE